jgi:ABC-type transport system involved in cytochrome bd biosynthesis fused ATPase/permease subunit
MLSAQRGCSRSSLTRTRTGSRSRARSWPAAAISASGRDRCVRSLTPSLVAQQHQIIALARAIVRQSKLLVLDEATSAIDYETDAVIQASLRTELKRDVTVITVAHRLQTVMDSDKIVSILAECCQPRTDGIES